jgi:CRP-like cAMP-binding protein
MRAKSDFEKRHYAAGAALAQEGDPGREAFVILRGHVAVQLQTGGKVVRIVRTEGDVVGEMSLVDVSPRCATLVAEDEVDVEVVSFTDFHGLLNTCHPRVQAAVKKLTALLRDANRGTPRATTAAALAELRAKVTGLPEFPSMLEGCHPLVRAALAGLLERLGAPDARLALPRR